MNTFQSTPVQSLTSHLQQLFDAELEYYKEKGIPLSSHDRKDLFLELRDNLDWWRNN